MQLEYSFRAVSNISAEHVEREKEHARMELLRKFAADIQPDEIHTIRFRPWQSRVFLDSYDMTTEHILRADVGKAERMQMRHALPPVYSQMRLPELSATAFDELKYRWRNRIKTRGWFAPVSDFFRSLEKAQGWTR